jgi:hypothetical protein
MVPVKLYMMLNSKSRHVLSIPVEKCKELSLKPLKWLRFVGYTIYGREGFISLTKSAVEIADYDSEIESRC